MREERKKELDDIRLKIKSGEISREEARALSSDVRKKTKDAREKNQESFKAAMKERVGKKREERVEKIEDKLQKMEEENPERAEEVRMEMEKREAERVEIKNKVDSGEIAEKDARKILSKKREKRLGGDRSKEGCIGSAGYT
jgi:polyhydroxyalkanoate synthesis regulator phasin